MKKNVAICVSGQPRFYERGYYEFMLPIIQHNNEFNFDFFIHTWFDNNLIGKQFDSSIWNNGKLDMCDENTITNIKKLYNPKIFLHESPTEFVFKNNYETYKAKQPTFITFSMFLSINKSNRIKNIYTEKVKKKYDYVIRTRFDWKLIDMITITDLNPNNLYLPNDCPTINAVNDQFAISSEKNMDVYSDTFFYIDQYWSINKIILANESLLYHHLHTNNIPIIGLTNKYEFIRK